MANASPRVLLFVHGTFSSTAGAFGDLQATRWGRDFLKKASGEYGALLGYDHRSLAADPAENAKGLYAALKTLHAAQPPIIDVICHSRGALVIRWLIEKILPGLDHPFRIGKVIFVGSTNAGTELARPENWHALLDLLSNLALAGRRALSWIAGPQSGFAAFELVSGIGDFVRYLVDAAVTQKRAPGLAAMDPSGPFIRDINRAENGAPTADEAQYYAIVSSFRPVLVDASRHEPKEFPRRLALMMANGFVGALMERAPNDLVVNVSSMSAIDPGSGGFVKAIQDFGFNPLVYHTNYFVQPETVDALARWLGWSDLGAVKAVDAELVDRRIVVVDAKELVKDVLSKADAGDAAYVVLRRPDPRFPGVLQYAPSVDEIRGAWPEMPIGDALSVQEGRRSRVVADGPFLRSLGSRPPLTSASHLPDYSRRAVVMEGGKPVGVIPTNEFAADVLNRATRTARVLDINRPAGFEALAMGTSRVASPAPAQTPVTAEPVVCNVQAEMPPTVKVGSSATVTVTLSADVINATPGFIAESASAFFKPGPVIVEVHPKVGFRLKSNDVGHSRIELPNPPAPNKTCIMHVEVVATDEGPGEIWVIVRQGPIRAVTLVLHPQMVGTSAGPSAAPLVSRGAVVSGEDLPQVATLEIMQQRNGNETRFRYSVNVPNEIFNRFESPPIIGDLAAWVKTLYADIEGAWLGSAGNIEIFNENLKAKGAALFRELIPAHLVDLLWRLHREGKLKSILVCSDEPFVPWEIAWLDDPAAGGHVDACFLGQLGLCRWLYGAVFPLRIRVRPGRMRYVVPHYPAPEYRLPAAEQAEESMLLAMGAERISPHYRDVTAALQSGEFDLLHFAGHGGADAAAISGAVVLLEGAYQTVDGQSRYVTEPLSAAVVAQKGKLAGPDGNRPLVVLNACQVGKIGFNLTSLGGFAPAFLGARMGESRGVGEAGAFISSLWSVGDQPAFHFAEAFYAALRVPGGAGIASAVVAAREAARAAGDATWLAYTVYSHPNCWVEFPP